jgi:hypothetical protein
MRRAAPLALLVFGVSCAETPPAPPRDETRYWLEVCAAHGFSQVETAMATGREAPEVARLQSGIRPPPKPADRLLLLPYPGGRHPRIGFLEGAVDPHRDTKCSVFLPWAGGGYAVIDVPEAVWCEKELVYLAHTHLPTKWDKQGVRLERIDWSRGEGGVLRSRRVLPDGLEFSVTVEPAADGARMELRLRNGSERTLTGLRAQVCVMLKGAPGFNAQTRENKLKIDGAGVCAVRSEDGRRWIATVFEKPRLWENPPCPCIHSDPQFPDLAPGEETRSRGRLFVYEGDDLEAEVVRRVRAGRLLTP